MANDTERLIRAFKDLHFVAGDILMRLEQKPKLPPLAQDLENTWEALQKAQVDKDHKPIGFHITKLGATLLAYSFDALLEWSRNAGRNVGELPTNSEPIEISRNRQVEVSSVVEDVNDQGVLLIEISSAEERLRARITFGPNVGAHNALEELEMEYGLDSDETGVCLGYKIKFDGTTVSTIERRLYTLFEEENVPPMWSVSQIDCTNIARHLNKRKPI